LASLGQNTFDLVLNFAKENPTWGYDRSEGAFANSESRRNLDEARRQKRQRLRRVLERQALLADRSGHEVLSFVPRDPGSRGCNTCLTLPKRSPNLIGHIEKFMKSASDF
jgi:hypothetical protein